MPAGRTQSGEAQPAEVDRITIRKLKKACGLTELGNSTFQRARDEALRLVPEWELVGASLRRADF